MIDQRDTSQDAVASLMAVERIINGDHAVTVIVMIVVIATKNVTQDAGDLAALGNAVDSEMAWTVTDRNDLEVAWAATDSADVTKDLMTDVMVSAVVTDVMIDLVAIERDVMTDLVAVADVMTDLVAIERDAMTDLVAVVDVMTDLVVIEVEDLATDQAVIVVSVVVVIVVNVVVVVVVICGEALEPRRLQNLKQKKHLPKPKKLMNGILSQRRRREDVKSLVI